jgi:hypothetical protein
METRVKRIRSKRLGYGLWQTEIETTDGRGFYGSGSGRKAATSRAEFNLRNGRTARQWGPER